MILKTENKELWETVQKGLQANKEKYGKRYCPCSLVRNNNTVCMCKEFRDSPSGTTCHCGIYTKV
jgi:ferredoxin-thioredoxin reductase catalytic subunit